MTLHMLPCSAMEYRCPVHGAHLLVQQLTEPVSSVHCKIKFVVQGAKPRVAFALASAISAAVEGSAAAAQLVADNGGIQLLVRIMQHGSGHGKKAAAEALQVPSPSSDHFLTIGSSKLLVHVCFCMAIRKHHEVCPGSLPSVL
jgi:hypothetical protein